MVQWAENADVDREMQSHDEVMQTARMVGGMSVVTKAVGYADNSGLVAVELRPSLTKMRRSSGVGESRLVESEGGPH